MGGASFSRRREGLANWLAAGCVPLVRLGEYSDNAFSRTGVAFSCYAKENWGDFPIYLDAVLLIFSGRNWINPLVNT